MINQISIIILITLKKLYISFNFSFLNSNALLRVSIGFVLSIALARLTMHVKKQTS